ncbi:hypothetical protein D0T85_14185 [Bacteroides sp. 519]|nr:hypothetical protein [Bacteroides sp. 519]
MGTTVCAQSKQDFLEYIQKRQAEFDKYSQQVENDFKAYRDSINQAFGAYLAKEWKSFDLQTPEPPIKKPISVPPVYKPLQPLPKPVKAVPPIAPIEKPKPLPIVVPIPEISLQYPIKATFFGTNISLKDLPQSTLQLSGITEREVAACWLTISKLPHYEWEEETMRIKQELNLNDWGVYQLLNTLFDVYFPQGSNNAQVVFNVFMLNQLGYRAKIGRSNNKLLPLVAFQNMVFNSPYFVYGDEVAIRYSALNPSRQSLSRVETCEIDYASAIKNMDLSISTSPYLAVEPATKTLSPGKDEVYNIMYNKNMVNFYADYPDVYFSVYAEAALDETLLKSIEEQIAPFISSQSQEEAVNFLLHFVQKSFDYKTDHDQFGYEKWFFAEETIASSYSDCEDRAILFTQLVRRLLDMPVVLINYPDVHLAAAVKFDNPQTTGDYVMVDGEKYLICDPTYIGASLGMGMPQLGSTSVEIIQLDKE